MPETCSKFFDHMFRFCPQEDDYGVELSIIQSINSIRSDINITPGKCNRDKQVIEEEGEIKVLAAVAADPQISSCEIAQGSGMNQASVLQVYTPSELSDDEIESEECISNSNGSSSASSSDESDNKNDDAPGPSKRTRTTVRCKNDRLERRDPDVDGCGEYISPLAKYSIPPHVQVGGLGGGADGFQYPRLCKSAMIGWSKGCVNLSVKEYKGYWYWLPLDSIMGINSNNPRRRYDVYVYIQCVSHIFVPGSGGKSKKLRMDWALHRLLRSLEERVIFIKLSPASSPTATIRVSQSPYQETNLHELLKNLGFRFRTLNRRQIIMESARIVTWMYSSLNRLNELRTAACPIIFIDETWYDTHDLVRKGWDDGICSCCLQAPSSRGKRIMILHVGSSDSWIPECLYLSSESISDSMADSQDEMNGTCFEGYTNCEDRTGFLL
ncbi:hypothetical protein C0J52_15361 [Blattella germanica]|nr:hypothetical protein C0J52_15361 [Blattella germanica]